MNSTKVADVAVSPEQEWDAVLSLTKGAYIEYAESSPEGFWNNYEKSFSNTVLNDKSVIRIVAKIDGTIVGSVLYCPPYERKMGSAIVKNPFPEMRLLAVPPEHRNKQIAGQLIEYCETQARESGSPTITLHTTALMDTAKQMYERRGYLRYPEIDFEPVPGFLVEGYRKDFEK